MDDDQFQGGLSGQGGNPAPANNSNTYDFTNGDPLASMDNPEAAAEAAAAADPADNIAVDPLANEPIMDLTNNVNIAAPEVPAEPEAQPAPEPEGPISEMSRRMDMELGNVDGTPSQADVPASEPEVPAAEAAPSETLMADATAPAGEPAVEATPQILAPEAPSEAAPDSTAMSFETTDIPGQTPAPAPSDDIPSFAGESRPSIATVDNNGKKPNKTLIIILIAVIVLIGGTVAAMMIIPSLSGKGKSNNGSSSQTNNNSNNNSGSNEEEEEEEEEEVEKTKVVGRVDKGYITIPSTWEQVLDPDDETLVKYKDADGDFVVFVNSGKITDVKAADFTNLQLSFSKEEAKDPESLKVTEKKIGDYSMYEIKYYSTATQKYTYKYIFESAKSGYTYFIWMECTDEDSAYFTSIPKSFTTVKK